MSRRNNLTIDCECCDATGRIGPKNNEYPCPACEGDGWNYAENDGHASMRMIAIKAEGTDEQMQELLRRTVQGMTQ